jgi:hypothetical protein
MSLSLPEIQEMIPSRKKITDIQNMKIVVVYGKLTA